MKNTLDFYSKIYEPLFKKNYTKTLDRAGVAKVKFEEFMRQNDVKITSMIDVGCAWGKTLKYWKKKKTKVVGVDVSKRMVEKCKRQGYKCYLASATDLSIFSDKKFDLYMATDVYEHLRTKDLLHAIEEAKRITKKYLLIRPHPALDKRGRRDIRKALHLTVWSLEEWEFFFKDNGLTIIKIGEDGETTYKNVFLMSINK
jgi:cyclopropane fatty-acyl-phospholipid synthase-like methyltransferase